MKNYVLMLIAFVSLNVMVNGQNPESQYSKFKTSKNSVEKPVEDIQTDIDIKLRGKRNQIRYDSYNSCRAFYDDLLDGQVSLPAGYSTKDLVSCTVRNGIVYIDLENQLNVKDVEEKKEVTQMIPGKMPPGEIKGKIKVTWADGRGGTKETVEDYNSCQEFYDANPNLPGDEWMWHSCNYGANGVKVTWYRNLPVKKDKRGSNSKE